MRPHHKPYSDYRNTSCKWIESIPFHWDLKRIDTVAEMRVSNVDKNTNEDESPVRLCNYVDVYKNDQIKADMHFMRASASGNEISRFHLEYDDVLITKDSEAWNDIGIPAYVASTSPDLISGYHLALLRPTSGIHGAYLFRALQSRNLAYQFHTEAKGVTRYGLSHLAIRTAQLPVPPRDEQQSIVRFLNYIDRRIQKYIRAKKKLIKLLEEQKQAIINQAVTKGLNPDVKMKPSGIEWLGEIPEHWKTPLSQRIYKEEIRPHNGFPEIPLSLSQKDGLIESDNLKERTLKTSTYDNWKVVTPGDLVLNRFKAHLGVFFASKLKGIVSFHYGVYKPRLVLSSKYYEYLYHTETYRTIFAGLSNGMTIGLQNLSNQNFYNAHSLLPPYPEQVQIVEYCDAQDTRIQQVSDQCAREIALLEEYRTRLISDVVTGKIDVREIATQLPDEDESEVPELDDALDEAIEDLENEVEDEE